MNKGPGYDLHTISVSGGDRFFPVAHVVAVYTQTSIRLDRSSTLSTTAFHSHV